VVTVIQRLASNLRLNGHFHGPYLDGVFIRDPAADKLRFHALPPPTTEDVEKLVAALAKKVEGWLARRGFGLDDEGAVPEEAHPPHPGSAGGGPSSHRPSARPGTGTTCTAPAP
jgi:hypothetical protein